MFAKALMRGFLAVAVLASAVTARADVFNMPTGQTSLDFVTVGNPGNGPDTAWSPSYGAVSYTYQIGKYDVTAGQYCDFLNAVAQTADPYGLYYSWMANTGGSMFTGCGIVQTSGPTGYSYSVVSGWANMPVNYVSWGSGAVLQLAAKWSAIRARGQWYNRDGVLLLERWNVQRGADRGYAVYHGQLCDSHRGRVVQGGVLRPDVERWLRWLLDLGDQEQHRAHQYLVCDGHEQRQLLRLLRHRHRRLHRPDEHPYTGGRFCRLAKRVRHVRYGRRCRRMGRGGNQRYLA